MILGLNARFDNIYLLRELSVLLGPLVREALCLDRELRERKRELYPPPD